MDILHLSRIHGSILYYIGMYEELVWTVWTVWSETSQVRFYNIT